METAKHIYETIFVLHPELAEEEVEANIQNIIGLLEGKGSEIIRTERGGKRRGAPPVPSGGRGIAHASILTRGSIRP